MVFVLKQAWANDVIHVKMDAVSVFVRDYSRSESWRWRDKYLSTRAKKNGRPIELYSYYFLGILWLYQITQFRSIRWHKTNFRLQLRVLVRLRILSQASSYPFVLTSTNSRLLGISFFYEKYSFHKRQIKDGRKE